MKYKAILVALCAVLLLGGCAPSEPLHGTVVDKYTYRNEATYIELGSLYVPAGGSQYHKLVVKSEDGTVSETIVSQTDYYSYEIGDEYPRPVQGEHDDTP